MKISILTLQNIHNYGSMLQGYATQILFEKEGYEVEIVNYVRKDAAFWTSIRDYGKDNNRLKGLAKMIAVIPTKIKFTLIWNKFSKKHLKLSNYKYFTEDDFHKHKIEADIYCVGSDQVWNTKWNKGLLPEFFLSYAYGKKRISFCSSIGKAELSDDEKSFFSNYLNDFSKISVRENRAVEILNDIGIKNVDLLLDPTLLVGNDVWNHLAYKRRLIKKNYLLVYQLNNNKNFDQYVENFAKTHHLKLVRIGIRLDQFLKNGKVITVPSLEKFLSLFKYADFVITDSFHATAFSLNFKKQFGIIYPNEFSSRLKSILELTNTLGRVITKYDDFSLYNQLIDYKSIDLFLNNERNRGANFIKSLMDAD